MVTKHKQGFTLVEMLIVIALSSMLMLTITWVVITLYQTYFYLSAQAEATNVAREAMSVLVRDVREMTFADDGSFPLVEMATQTAAFYSDVDVDDNVELIRYSVASSGLVKDVHNPSGSPPVYDATTPDETSIIAKDIVNQARGTSTFRYYDSSGIQLTSMADIARVRYITVELHVDSNLSQEPPPFIIQSSATLRNLKEIL